MSTYKLLMDIVAILIRTHLSVSPHSKNLLARNLGQKFWTNTFASAQWLRG